MTSPSSSPTTADESEPERSDEPVEDFAAAAPAPPEDAADPVVAEVEEAAYELERHSQPGQL